MATTPLVKMVVLKAFRYGGFQRQVGDTIDVKSKEAKILAAIKRAELAESEPEHPASNTYATREMHAAEDTTPQPAAATRRAYTGRRNLLAK